MVTHSHPDSQLPPQDKLDLDPRVEEVLLKEPLSSPTEIRDCELAAASLQQSLQALEELPSGVEVLQAVTEQTETFHNLSASFGRRLHSHISGIFTLNVCSSTGYCIELCTHNNNYCMSLWFCTRRNQVKATMLGIQYLSCCISEMAFSLVDAQHVELQNSLYITHHYLPIIIIY